MPSRSTVVLVFLRLSSALLLVRTSESSTKGGPSAMSSAFVPGRILLDAPLSTALPGKLPCSSYNDTPGEVGPT